MTAGLKVVEQAASVLFFLGSNARGCGVRELARELGISKSTVHRILASLQHRSLISFNETTGRYALGAGVMELSHAFTAQNGDLIHIARSNLQSIRHATGETVVLSAAIEWYRVTLDQLESPSPLRFASQVGYRYPLLLGATGRVLLGMLDQEKVELALAENAIPHRDACLMTSDQLMKRIESVRTAGFDTSSGELVDGATAVAVPIGVLNDTPIALSVYMPTHRLDWAHLATLVVQLQDAASQVRRNTDALSGHSAPARLDLDANGVLRQSRGSQSRSEQSHADNASLEGESS